MTTKALILGAMLALRPPRHLSRAENRCNCYEETPSRNSSWPSAGALLAGYWILVAVMSPPP